MKRVYAMRGALLLLDYEEEATGPFRALLLQVSQPRGVGWGGVGCKDGRQPAGFVPALSTHGSIPPSFPPQCFLKPTYLRSADGRRMLTYLFGLHPALVADIHETVKAQLPHVRVHTCACSLIASARVCAPEASPASA